MAKIAVLPGDGVGPEVTAEAVKVLRAADQRFGLGLEFETYAVGGDALDQFGVPVRDEDIAQWRQSDAILLGAVGGPKWDGVDPSLRPERGLLRIRQTLGLFANLRPVAVFPELVDTSPLKEEIVAGTDLLVVRELTGGIYFGQPSKRWEDDDGRAAVDTLTYREDEIERVLRLGFELARHRRRHLASVDKSNVLQSSRLWREIANELQPEYPDVTLEHVLVDAMAMHLVKSPRRFDVVVTENMFGDILTDEASVLAGSIGLLPSASLGAQLDGSSGQRLGLYEPIHGSAPDLAGQNVANPVGTILSAAMLLRWSLGQAVAAQAIESAVSRTLADGVRTVDVATAGSPHVGTSQFGDAVAERIEA